MNTISLKIPVDLARRLEARARALGTSKSAVVRDAIERALGEGDAPRSALARARHLAGILEGPGDLSTNPRYLDDLGRT